VDRHQPGGAARGRPARGRPALVTEDFEDYIQLQPGAGLRRPVFTTNAYVAAQSILFGVLLGIPVLYVLLLNASTWAWPAG
jgi:hypothetical protein